MDSRLISIVCGSSFLDRRNKRYGLCRRYGRQSTAATGAAAVWDWSGFYVGAGGSYNWTHFDQSFLGVSGVISVFNGPVLTAQGQEGGPFFDFNRNKSGCAPDVQLGYMHPFAGGDCRWPGSNSALQKYANIDSKAEREHSPRTGPVPS